MFYRFFDVICFLILPGFLVDVLVHLLSQFLVSFLSGHVPSACVFVISAAFPYRMFPCGPLNPFLFYFVLLMSSLISFDCFQCLFKIPSPFVGYGYLQLVSLISLFHWKPLCSLDFLFVNLGAHFLGSSFSLVLEGI